MNEKSQQERTFEIGKDEAWFANVKRMFDEYQEIGLASCKQNARYSEKVLNDAQQFDNSRQVIANQALQNAVETANIVSKQAVRHSDLAIDRQWNLDEVSKYASTVAVGFDAFLTIMAAKIAEELKKTNASS